MERPPDNGAREGESLGVHLGDAEETVVSVVDGTNEGDGSLYNSRRIRFRERAEEKLYLKRAVSESYRRDVTRREDKGLRRIVPFREGRVENRRVRWGRVRL